jgi:bifunctional non-homologous end joining protein LigD
MKGRFLIGGYVAGAEGIEELILGEKRQGKLHYVGRVKAGFGGQARQIITEAIKPLKQPGCPFVDLPGRTDVGEGGSGKQCFWVNPRGSVEVAFSEWTGARRLRQARFAGLG